MKDRPQVSFQSSSLQLNYPQTKCKSTSNEWILFYLPAKINETNAWDDDMDDQITFDDCDVGEDEIDDVSFIN